MNEGLAGRDASPFSQTIISLEMCGPLYFEALLIPDYTHHYSQIIDGYPSGELSIHPNERYESVPLFREHEKDHPGT